MFNPQLAIFVCVADCGSFSQAAERLYLSSTAVMKQLNALERHLELKLLERTGRGTVLTPAGGVIYRYARQMFADSGRALREARMATQATRFAFCVGTSILNPCRPFMGLWYRFCGHFPGYQLHLVPCEDDHQGILGKIGALGEKFDFPIGVCDSRQWLNRCNFLPLGEYRHCIAVPRGHPLTGRKGLTLAELHRETLMMVKQGDSPSVDRVRAAVKAYPQIHIEDIPQFYDMEMFNRSVQTGHLLMSLDCWTEVHPSLVVLLVDWSSIIPYGPFYQLRSGTDMARSVALVRGGGPAQEDNTPARFPVDALFGQKGDTGSAS